ncbi:glutathione S-transferase [Pleurocapsales cyanobacterium LEGE 06147]|nr:glutathione S-transferase [Pleurocapsales cyanobacterium LEGE 06147]
MFNTSQVPRLITISISHYCEKVRWALDWLKIPYVEESHAPPFHRLYTRRHGGTSVPVLVTETDTFVDSTDILHYLDTIAPEVNQLYPNQPELRREVEKLEELFDIKLGISTRCWSYFYSLKQPDLIKKGWCTGVPWREKIGCAIAFPLMCRLVERGYNITAEEAARSLQKIKTVFETVTERLRSRPQRGAKRSGNEYLVGNNFSAADLTFAALASPVLRPVNHPIYSSSIKKFPLEVVEVIQELRKTPAGAFALRLYRENRCKN